MTQLYRAEISLSDDPAWFSASIIVMAEDRKAALKAAKKAAISDYYNEAGGWALKPKVEHATCERYTLPDDGIVMVSGHYDR